MNDVKKVIDFTTQASQVTSELLKSIMKDFCQVRLKNQAGKCTVNLPKLGNWRTSKLQKTTSKIFKDGSKV